jgi:hypothetical protein
MEETNGNDVKVDAPEPHDFASAVERALKSRNVKMRCHDCGLVGRAGFHLYGAPVVTPTSVEGQVLFSACFVCGKCGAQKLYNLNVLGLEMRREERRIVTPGQGQPQQLIVPV